MFIVAWVFGNDFIYLLVIIICEFKWSSLCVVGRVPMIDKGAELFLLEGEDA